MDIYQHTMHINSMHINILVLQKYQEYERQKYKITTQKQISLTDSKLFLDRIYIPNKNFTQRKS